MDPDPILTNNNITPEECVFTFVEPGSMEPKGTIEYNKLFEMYDAIVPDFVITYNMVKVEALIGSDEIYDTIITVNKPYSGNVMVFTLFEFMMQTDVMHHYPFFKTHCPNNLLESTYAKIEKIQNPQFTQEHAAIVPWLHIGGRVVKTEVVSCYYADHFPFGIKEPRFVMNVFGTNRNNYRNIYDRYGWSTDKIELLDDKPYIYSKLSELIMEYLKVYIFDRTIGPGLELRHIQGGSQNMSSDEFLDLFNSSSEAKGFTINYIDRFLKLSNVYEEMPLGFPFNKIDSSSIQIKRYTNEISYSEFLEDYYKEKRYILKMYFMKSRDVLLITYKLLPEDKSKKSYSTSPLTEEEKQIFLSHKK